MPIKAWAPTAGQGVFDWTPGAVDDWDADDVDWSYDNWAIQPHGSNPWRFRNNDASVTAQVWDPWDTGNSESSPGASILIDTYPTTGNSSKLSETFIDEEYRLIKGAASYTAWDPLVTLSNNLTGSNVTSTGVSSGPFSDACTVGSNLVQGSKYFEVSAGNLNRPIASFELAFKGKFPTTGNPYDELVNNNLIVYIRKKNNTQSPAINIGAGAVPHSLHNGNMSGANGSFNAAYANPPTSVDANDGTAQCRTTASAPGSPGGGWYVIAGSFGQPVTQCMDGFYIEVHYRDENIRIDDLRCKVFFAAGSPTSEPTNASEPNWPQ